MTKWINSRNSPGLFERSVVKDQEEFVLLLQALDGVSSTLGEVPDITVVESLYLMTAELIDN